MQKSFLSVLLAFLCSPVLVSAHGDSTHPGYLMTDVDTLRSLQIPVLFEDSFSGLAVTYGTTEITNRLSAHNHLHGKCGGFEALPASANPTQVLSTTSQVLNSQMQMNRLPLMPRPIESRATIESALGEVSTDNLRATIEWLMSYPTRFNKGSTPNRHVEDLKTRLEQMVAGSSLPIEIKLISHNSTPQKSVHLRIKGSKNPQEIIVMGGHLDSISGWTGSGRAPGADDDASGSANLIEALRILLLKNAAPERTIDFFWYAGEESGLLGSGEIAEQYKQSGADVVAVLQLDMTLYPGEGEFTIGNVSDFTTAWLRDYLSSINNTYLKVRMVEDKCGYACSDHASWYRRGYATLMPFEATTRTMNPNIHTANDIINSKSSLAHSAVFTKIALIFAMDLANSDQRPTRM